MVTSLKNVKLRSGVERLANYLLCQHEIQNRPSMRARWLVKLALAIGGGSEGAVHSHARRALAEGLTRDEIKHAALLAITTLGFPQAIAALSWIEDITDPGGRDGAP
jgi:alkylhydroperoxidase/carboxymuconolactone decarboxylase family protein YurZ